MVTGRPLRIAYFGTPDFAVPSLRRLLASRHPVVTVVSQPDRPKGRGHHLAPTPTRVVALAAQVDVRQPDRIRDEGFLSGLAALEPDLGVVAAYGKILPDALLRIPRLGLINVHASLLPRWRGAAPVHRAVIAGDTETGVTIMRIVKELDAGAMFLARRRPIGPDETSPEVERDLAEIGADALLEVVEQLAQGTADETPQDDSLATYAPKIAKHEGAIDWTLAAASIHNLVRGLQPWPLVSGRLQEKRVLIHRTALSSEQTSAQPGVVARADRDQLEIAGGDGRLVRILEIQPEGRRIMTARDFLSGHHVEAGARIEPA
jgi:methionyl-tRNA formyltransferase